jgi:hypothetical protein
MSTEFKLGEAYAFLVQSGLFQHNGRSGPTNEVPESLKQRKNLDGVPLRNLESAVSKQIQILKDSETSSLPNIKVNDGFRQEDVLKTVVEVATALEMEGAEEASKSALPCPLTSTCSWVESLISGRTDYRT